MLHTQFLQLTKIKPSFQCSQAGQWEGVSLKQKVLILVGHSGQYNREGKQSMLNNILTSQANRRAAIREEGRVESAMLLSSHPPLISHLPLLLNVQLLTPSIFIELILQTPIRYHVLLQSIQLLLVLSIAVVLLLRVRLTPLIRTIYIEIIFCLICYWGDIVRGQMFLLSSLFLGSNLTQLLLKLLNLSLCLFQLLPIRIRLILIEEILLNNPAWLGLLSFQVALYLQTLLFFVSIGKSGSLSPSRFVLNP